MPKSAHQIKMNAVFFSAFPPNTHTHTHARTDSTLIMVFLLHLRYKFVLDLFVLARRVLIVEQRLYVFFVGGLQRLGLRRHLRHDQLQLALQFGQLRKELRARVHHFVHRAERVDQVGILLLFDSILNDQACISIRKRTSLLTDIKYEVCIMRTHLSHLTMPMPLYYFSKMRFKKKSQTSSSSNMQSLLPLSVALETFVELFDECYYVVRGQHAYGFGDYFFVFVLQNVLE